MTVEKTTPATGSQASGSSGAQDGPAPGKSAEPERSGSDSPPKAAAARRSKPASSIKKRLLAGLIAVAVVGAIGAAGAYFGWQWLQQRQQALAALQAQLAAQRAELQRLAESLQRGARSRENDIDALRQTLAAVQQRLESHNKRLLSLSSADRSDWRLAEAEYLLQLANQRLVIERDTRNAEALLSAADAILRDLSDIDLFAVRQGIERDLTALKLAGDVDREGIYLRLAALAEQIEVLPLFPTLSADRQQPTTQAATADELAAETPGSWFDVVTRSLRQALGKVSDYIRIRHHEQPLEPLLPPDSEAYLRQNLRLMLERAQLALLREKPLIYRQSLQQARDWLMRYYPLAEKRITFDAQLAELQQQNIVQELPDISQSLEQLQAYIERLHQLKTVEPSTREGAAP